MKYDLSKLPKFKYHPNIYDPEKVCDGVIFGEGVCQCCGKAVDVYVGHIYSAEDIDCICMNCVADGSAAKKFDGEFIQDAEKVSDKAKTDELFKRTPGYCSWQGENWLSCCDDYCEYLGDVGYTQLKSMGLEHIIDEHKAESGIDFDNNMVTSGGSLAGYLFRCIHCGKYRLWTDCD